MIVNANNQFSFKTDNKQEFAELTHKFTPNKNELRQDEKAKEIERIAKKLRCSMEN
ncbi:MAG TPA: hypothetical protein H9803_06695 [Candidatus Ligilactobacillus excrementavium]|nr:hypothetical protein [Candidatus Ligilactobacillus excrementavium]